MFSHRTVRVLSVVKVWIVKYWYDFRRDHDELRKQLENVAESYEDSTLVTLIKRIDTNVNCSFPISMLT